MNAMRKIFALAILLGPVSLFAQPSSPPSIILVSTAPTGSCATGLPNQQVITTGAMYSCQNGTWGAIGGGGSTVTSAIQDKGGQVYNVKAYGAVGNAQSRSDCSISSGTTALTCTGGAFTSGMNLAVVAMGDNAISNGTYTSGGSITGSSGQSCNLTFATPSGGVAATAKVYLTGSNVIAGGTQLIFTPSTMGSKYTSAPTTATFSSGTATCSGSPTLATSIYPLPVMTTATYVSPTAMTLGTAATNTLSNGKAAVGTDDTTAIQAAITAASANNGQVYFPPANYAIQGLTIGFPMTLSGASIQSAEAGNGELISSYPYLLGSVLWMFKPNTDAVKTTVSQKGVNFSNLGIVFDPTIAFWQTGNGFNGSATDPNVGLVNASWDNLFVWGVDGNHFSFALVNSNLVMTDNLYSYGGGGLQFHSTANLPCCAGNSGIGNIYISIFAGGTSSGVSVTSDGANKENLLDFYSRLQVNENGQSNFAGWPIPVPWLKNSTEPQLVYIPSTINSVTIFASDIEPLSGSLFTFPYNVHFRLFNATPASTPSYMPVVGSAASVTNPVGDFMTATQGNSPTFTDFDGAITAIGSIKSSTGFSGYGIMMGNGTFDDGIATVYAGNTAYTGHLTNTTSAIMEQLDTSGNVQFSGTVRGTGFNAGGTAGFTGTKTAGSCVLTISGGIITNVTGC